MAEPDQSDERDLRIKWLEEQVRLQQGTIEYMHDLVEGLQYELRVRDIRIEELRKDNDLLRKRLEEQAPPSVPPPPPFAKPNKPRRRRKPGRKAGHEPALRPPPRKIDRRVTVPPQRDKSGRAVCPCCRCGLKKMRRHKRVVEDLVPAHVEVTCYRTCSGWCPRCRKRFESRAPGQPPAADLPHAQLGLNALATAAVLRVENRLPFRQIAQLLSDLPGLRVCAGALARQVQRLGGWLGGEWEGLKLRLRSARSAYADETGHRTNGRNQWLWTVTENRHTLYHVDGSRGGKVIRDLLGEAFGGTLVCDFYGGYDRMNCPKQRCNIHLLRELKETAHKNPAFAAHPFRRRCKRLVRQMLVLKRRWDELGDAAYTHRACRLEDRLEALAKEHASDGDADVRRLAARLAKHKEELTAFLWDKELEGSNNQAERALRPAVVARKISGGSRSAAGAQAWATVASVVRTARQQGRHVLDTLKMLLMRAWAGEEPGYLASG